MRKITVVQVIPRIRSGGAELGCLQVAEALVPLARIARYPANRTRHGRT